MTSDIDGNSIELSKRQVKGIMHEHSGRVSDDAAIKMAHIAERDIHRKARSAALVAQSNGRKTIKEEDVRVVENIMNVMKGEE